MKCVANLEDSGFFDDCESVLDNSLKFDSEVDKVLVVEDDAFDIIESSVEAFLQAQGDSKEHKYGLRSRGQPCTKKSTASLSEPLQTSTPQTTLRKRGRPAKTKFLVETLDESKDYCMDESELFVKEEKTRKRGRPSKSKSLKANEEILLTEETDQEIDHLEESPMKKSKIYEVDSETTEIKCERLSKNKKLSQSDEEILLVEDTDEDINYVEESPSPLQRKRGRPSKNKIKKNNLMKTPYEEMSPYEKIRADNIKERDDMLLALGIKEAFEEYKKDVGLGSRIAGTRKQKVEQVDRRRSSRLEGKDEDADYNPEDENDHIEDPSDHTHNGLRKHPCKECANCLLPDCRRCIFCKDKRKYGGPNIKKQKCEYKEKCTNPIILCYVCNWCNGKRTFSCLVCETQFHEMFQLEDHNKDVHQAKKVVRRNARLTEKVSPVI